MPDPNWTAEYNTSQTPEQNGFTRRLTGTPTVTEVISGNPSDRRVEINSDTGDAVFLTSNVPSLNLTSGATAEALVSVNGQGGDAGFELTFLNAAVLLMVYETAVEISWPSGGGIDGGDVTVGTPSNASDTRFRLLIKPNRDVEVYREGSLVIGPTPVSAPDKPFQRVLWWGEGGGVQVFKEMSFYIGGPVVPG